MKHTLQLTLEVDTFSEAGEDRVCAVLIAALRTTHKMFSAKGIHQSGKAETMDNVRINWSTHTEDTHQ
jgi:hypothetical protein